MPWPAARGDGVVAVITSRPKRSGIFDGLSSTAIFWSTLNCFLSVSHRTEPAPPLRMTSAGLGPGKNAKAPTWVSCPIFSSRLIRPSRASTRAATSASDRTGAAVAAIVPTTRPQHPNRRPPRDAHGQSSSRRRAPTARAELPRASRPSLRRGRRLRHLHVMALSAIVNTLCYNPPMSHAGPKRAERKAKPFAQAVPAAPPSLKVRKQAGGAGRAERRRGGAVPFRVASRRPPSSRSRGRRASPAGLSSATTRPRRT